MRSYPQNGSFVEIEHRDAEDLVGRRLFLRRLIVALPSPPR